MKKGHDIYCNMCGKKQEGGQEMPLEEFVSVTKTWGYFSGQDGETHAFDLCESCYHKIISQFRIPVTKTELKEML